MSVVDEAWENFAQHMRRVRRHLQDLEDVANNVRMARKIITSGYVPMAGYAKARSLVGDVRHQVSCLEAALTRLAEGVDEDALVRQG